MANHEPGYRPMLVWGTTKIALQEIRQRIGAERYCEERWLITAAAELVLSRPELHEAWLKEVYAMESRETSYEASLETGAASSEPASVRAMLMTRAMEIEQAMQGEARIVRQSIRDVAAKVVQRLGATTGDNK